MAKAKTKKYTQFGKEVAKTLIDKDWDNNNLAKAIGVKAPYITDILQDNRKANQKKKDIVSILNMDESTLSLEGGIR